MPLRVVLGAFGPLGTKVSRMMRWVFPGRVQVRRLTSSELSDAYELVDATQLLVGDDVLLLPGEKVPVDGVVTEGLSALDESILTGQSSPVGCLPGTSVYAGTVNLTGPIAIRVIGAL